MIRSALKSSLSSLIHKLDGLVSEVVRRSAANEYGQVACISCGKIMHWKEADMAHFVRRGNNATRFNLINLAPACVQCNRFNEDEHLRVWAEKLGPEKVAYLEAEGRSLRKFFRSEVEKGIELMEAKLKELR